MAAGKREMMEDFVLVGGLIVIQILFAGNSVLLSYVMNLGPNPLTIVIFSSFFTFLLVFPSSIYFERSKWPKNFNFGLIMQLLLMSFGGGALFLMLFLEGVKLTSPAIASAMPNLAPGLIFIIAVTFRLEKVKLSCTYSKVKIMGTLLCVIGALIMSIMQSNSPLPEKNGSGHGHDHDLDLVRESSKGMFCFDASKIKGCMYLMASVVVLSSNIVLQAKTLVEFPAPISVCAITSFFGALITLAIELIQNHKLDFGMPQVMISTKHLLGVCIIGGMINGVSLSFNGWAIKKKGPVLVSMFNPISTVISAIITFFTLGEVLSGSSLFGMMVMFMGLYMFLWAKSKEGFSCPQTDFDMEKPLLS